MAQKQNHLALIRRDEMIELFKNGLVYPAYSIKFNCDIQILPKKTTEMRKLFEKVPVIEYSINYFILHAATEKKTSLLSQGLHIEDIVTIYPLDEDAAKMGLELNPPVKLGYPIFAQNLMDYQEDSAVRNALMGILNMGVIFGYNDLLKSIKKFNDKGHKTLGKLVSLIIDETGNRIPETIWEFLISYTRNQTYPNDIRGAFLDTMSVLNNFNKGRIDFKDQKLTTTGRMILEYPNPTYKTLLDCVATSGKYIESANKAFKDFWAIGPLYFILLNIFSNVSEDGAMVKNKPLKEFVSSIVNNYDESYLKPALLMLGITLGQSSTYKMLYNVCRDKLPFLKDS